MTSFKKFFVYFFVLSCIVALSYYLFVTYNSISITPEYEIKRINSTIPNETVDSAIENNNSVASVIESVSQCVVGISKLKSHSNSVFSSSFVDELGLGTGVIVSSNGYIISNFHVTGEKLSTCYITLANGYTYEGSVVWCDSDLDLSITKINANNLPYATIGDSSALRSGESVFAIGNPIGFEFKRTVTSGIISATNRTIKIEEDGNICYMSNLIQTDASINPR